MNEKAKTLTLKLEGVQLQMFEKIFKKSGFQTYTEFLRHLIKNEYSRKE